MTLTIDWDIARVYTENMKEVNYHSKIVGTTFENRQDILAHLEGDEGLRVRREPENQYDQRAVAVDVSIKGKWYPVGYIAKDKNKDIAEALDAGREVEIKISEVTGGDKGKNLGMNICLKYEKDNPEPISDAANDSGASQTPQEANLKNPTVYKSKVLGREITVGVDNGHIYLPHYMSGSRFPRKFFKQFTDEDKERVLDYYEREKDVKREDVEKTWEMKADIATGYGTAVHAALELYYGHNKVGDKIKGRDGVNKAFSKNPFFAHIVKCAVEDLGPGNYLPEQFIWHEGLRFCGAIDLLQVVDKNTVIVHDWKGLDLNTEIPTPYGFVKMKDLQVGDEVFDEDGNVCKIKNKSSVHFNPCYKIATKDGVSLIADHEHRWKVIRGVKQIEDVMTTEEIANSDEVIRIPVAGGIKTRGVELPVDPYVLGVWLADGCKNTGKITEARDSGVWGEIERRGYRLSHCLTPNNPTTSTRTVYDLVGKLREIGVLECKHIPDAYMLASEPQRRDLLAGYMDGDGNWNKARKQVAMSTTNLQQAQDVECLASSLGERVYLTDYTCRGFGLCKKAWMLTFNPLVNPFKTRNQSIDMKPSFNQTVRYISSVQLMETVPTQCIEVDSPKHTFLAGRQFVVTHNTNDSVTKRVYQEKDSPFKKDVDNTQLGEYWLQLSFYAHILKQYGINTKELQIHHLDPERLVQGKRPWVHYKHDVVDIFKALKED